MIIVFDRAVSLFLGFDPGELEVLRPLQSGTFSVSFFSAWYDDGVNNQTDISEAGWSRRTDKCIYMTSKSLEIGNVISEPAYVCPKAVFLWQRR